MLMDSCNYFCFAFVEGKYLLRKVYLKGSTQNCGNLQGMRTRNGVTIVS